MVGLDKEQLGILAIEDALRIAEEKGLDLVQVSSESSPPVCRVMDYDKYRYEQIKRGKEARKKQKTVELKEIKFKPNIEENDYQVKLRHVKEFLADRNKVKITLMFRGREMSHKEIGRRILERLTGDVSEQGEIDQPISSLGKRIMVMVLSPKGSTEKKQ
ncbi:MAG: translation initiation factor IF-3 [bacterium]|nr:translation initiation factor IF-3 [bacterium]